MGFGCKFLCCQSPPSAGFLYKYTYPGGLCAKLSSIILNIFIVLGNFSTNEATCQPIVVVPTPEMAKATLKHLRIATFDRFCRLRLSSKFSRMAYRPSVLFYVRPCSPPFLRACELVALQLPVRVVVGFPTVDPARLPRRRCLQPLLPDEHEQPLRLYRFCA